MAAKKRVPQPRAAAGESLRDLASSAESFRDLALLASAGLGTMIVDLNALAHAADLLAERLVQLATEAERNANGAAS